VLAYLFYRSVSECLGHKWAMFMSVNQPGMGFWGVQDYMQLQN